MMTDRSFFDNDDTLVSGAVIDCNDTSGAEFLDNIENNTPNILSYMFNARNGKKYDFKENGMGDLSNDEESKYHHRGMQVGEDKNGNKIFGSARDVGNYAAGYVAGYHGLEWCIARLGFDSYESLKSKRICREGPSTQAAQRLGHNLSIRNYYSRLLKGLSAY